MKHKFIKFTLLSVIATAIIACKNDDDDSTFNLAESYSIDRFKVLNIPTNISGTFTWKINDSLISENSTLDFISPFAKTYPLTLKVEANGTTTTYSSKIIVNKETSSYSKYIQTSLISVLPLDNSLMKFRNMSLEIRLKI